MSTGGLRVSLSHFLATGKWPQEVPLLDKGQGAATETGDRLCTTSEIVHGLRPKIPKER